MGMQIHFNRADLPEGTGVDIIHHSDSDTYSAVIRMENTPPMTVGYIHHMHSEHPFFYFDCGSASKDQLFMIGLLIRNRVCFQAS